MRINENSIDYCNLYVSLLDRFIPILESFGLNVIVPEVEERMEADALMPYAGQFDGTICGDDRYTPEVLKACAPRLKVIAKWGGTGIDSINLDAARELGIQVLNTPPTLLPCRCLKVC